MRILSLGYQNALTFQDLESTFTKFETLKILYLQHTIPFQYQQALKCDKPQKSSRVPRPSTKYDKCV